MPLDSGIPLSVKPIEVTSPAQSIGHFMQLRGELSRIALQQAQIQQAQQQTADIKAQADQRNRDLDSNRRLQSVLMDPSNHDAIGKGDFSAIWKAGVSPNIANPAIDQLQQQAQRAQALQSGKAAILEAGHKQLERTLLGLDKDDTLAAEQWNASLPILAQSHPEIASELQQLSPGPDFRNQLAKIAAANGVARSMYENAAKLEQEQSVTAKNTAEAGKANAEARKTVEADIPSIQIKTAMDQLKLLGKEPIQPKEAKDQEREAAMVAETGRHNRATEQTQGGELNVQRAKEARENKIYEATFGEGSDEALRGVDPKARTPARAAFLKAGQAHDKAVSAAEDMQSFIDLARSGNKAAYANIPVEGVLEITTPRGTVRVNRNELEAYGGAGSWWDKLAGHVGKAFSGASIPKDVLNSIEQLHKSLASNADKGFERAVGTVDETFRSNFSSKLQAGKATGLPDGAGKAIDKATAEQFYKAAGGDPAKARELAKQKGWAVQ